MSWVRRVGWLPPCHCRGNGPLQESPDKDCLVQKRAPAWIPAFWTFWARRATQGVQRVHNYGAVGVVGQPWALCASRRVSCGLCLGPGSQSETSRAGRALRSFGQPCLCLQRREDHTYNDYQILKMENHTLGKMCVVDYDRKNWVNYTYVRNSPKSKSNLKSITLLI